MRWKPIIGGKYYAIIYYYGFVIGTGLWEYKHTDCANYRANNCFRTRKEAEQKLKKIKQIMKEE